MARIVAGLAILAGLAAGTLRDPLWSYRDTPVVLDPDLHVRGGGLVLSADLHVHGFVGDGSLPPWELRREALRRGLDVIAITNHNQLIAARIAAAMNAEGRLPIVLVGQEITAPAYHMAAVGVTSPIDWRLSAKAAVAAIHAQRGVAIAAHPVGASWRDPDPDVLRVLDGAEIAHPARDAAPRFAAELTAFFTRARALNSFVGPIGSSDFHFVAPMGKYRTFLIARERSAEGVLEALRWRRTVAMDAVGTLYGTEGLKEAVRAHLAEQPLPAGPTWLDRAALFLVLAGLAALVLFE